MCTHHRPDMKLIDNPRPVSIVVNDSSFLVIVGRRSLSAGSLVGLDVQTDFGTFCQVFAVDVLV